MRKHILFFVSFVTFCSIFLLRPVELCRWAADHGDAHAAALGDVDYLLLDARTMSDTPYFVAAKPITV